MAASTTERDPYSQVLDELWKMLEEYPEFGILVPPGNRINFTGSNRAPIKDEVSDADLPEVRIVAVGSTVGQRGSSASTFDNAIYEIQVSSGDQRLDFRHLPLKWLVFRAMRKSLARLKLLTWNGRPFVANAKATTTTEGVSQADLNRGIMGWSAIWTCDIEMFFRTIDL